MTNLSATFKTDPRIGSAYELPVLVDLNWLGVIMTLPGGGISRRTQFISEVQDHEVIL